jgi:hypothetical protein
MIAQAERAARHGAGRLLGGVAGLCPHFEEGEVAPGFRESER